MKEHTHFVTIRQASELIVIPYWKLQRAAKAGVLKTYTFLNSRRLVSVAELIELVKEGQNGGAK